MQHSPAAPNLAPWPGLAEGQVVEQFSRKDMTQPMGLVREVQNEGVVIQCLGLFRHAEHIHSDSCKYKHVQRLVIW